MPFSTGHRPDHPEVVKRRVALHNLATYAAMMAAVASLPLASANRVNLLADKGGPGILDQHDTGSCEGHGHAESGTLRLANLGLSKGLISPTALYVGALLMDRTLNPDGTLSTVTDTGTMPASIQAAWQAFGARLATDDPQYPAQSTTLYQTPSNQNSPLILPSPEILHADSPYRYQGSYFVQSNGCQRILDVLTTLAAGRTLTNAIPASGSQFQGYRGGVLGALSGDIDHCNHVVDYAWNGSAPDFAAFLSALTTGNLSTATALAMAQGSAGVPNLVFICQNSWGDTAWGEADSMSRAPGGLYRADLNYLNQCEDPCVIDITAAA